MKAAVFALLLLATPAVAHETIFPHVHPHPLLSLAEDFLLTGLWFAVWSGVAYGGYRIYRRAVRGAK